MEKINLQHLDHDTLIAVVEAADWDEIQRLDLTNLNLLGIDLSGRDLTSLDFTGANLTGANFAVGLLAGANFTNAVLRRANLSHCVMEDTILTGTILTDADLTGSTFRSAWADELRLVNCGDVNDYLACQRYLEEEAEPHTYMDAGDGRHIWMTEETKQKLDWYRAGGMSKRIYLVNS